MTENEAIERIRSGICNERGTQRFCKDSCMYGIDKCAYSMAIQALEEIQQYRELGTVEEILKVFNNQRTIIATQHETLKQYRSIGTIEEFKALKEKSVAKKPTYNTYDDMEYRCPECETRVSGYEETIHWCFECGQKLDWSE